MNALPSHEESYRTWNVRGLPLWKDILYRALWDLGCRHDFLVNALMGQPESGLRHCQWDGSIHPADFVRLLQDPDTDVEVADWKYGWPHKVYLTTPNPHPEKQRIVSSSSHNAEGRPCPTYTWGTYQSLHLKFYTEHLREYELLPEYADLIFSSIGIWFKKDEKGLSWATKKPNTNPVST